MGRKNFEKSKLLKRLVSGTISLSLFLSLCPLQNTNAYDNTTRGSLSDMKEWVESYQKELQQLPEGVSPIKDGVNVYTEEYQSIIIEFKSLPRITSQALEGGNSKYSLNNDVYDEHNEFNKFLLTKSKEKTATYNVDHSYYDTFNGVAMKVKGTDIPILLDSTVVKAIWKDEEARVNPETQNTRSIEEASSRMITSTPLIEVDKLRSEGITGKGIKVGVLDTGIDYNHPDLKENYKEGGYDYVNNDNDPMETTYEDWVKSKQPEKDDYGTSYYTSHGTHVSGTIGANGNNSESEFAVTGIAPEAEIYAYKVLGPYGVGSSSDIIAAIEQSVKDGMDVINLSLGITTPSPLYPSSIACNNAAIAGVVPVVANGNAGPGSSTLGSPGTSALAISVGASTTNIAIDKFKLTTSNGVSVDGNLLARPFSSMESLFEKEYEIVYGSYGFDYELSEIDVEGKILFIDRGYLSFADKFNNAKEAGAVGLIIANNISGEMGFYFGESVDMIPGIGITMEDGQALKNAIIETKADEQVIEDEEVKADEEVKIEEKSEAVKIKVDLNGKTTTEADKLAEFSSRGPSSDETIKPDITAPGVGIFSTYPEYINNPEEGIDYTTAYARIDGTSMASPHIAGIVALMLQNNKELTPEQVKVAMMNNAEALAQDYGVNEIGAGRVNAYDAVHCDISIKVLDKCESLDANYDKVEVDYITGSMSFDRISKSEEDLSKSLELQVVNAGSTNKTFNISVEFLDENVGAKNAAINGVTLDIPKNVTIDAGSTINLKSVINVPANSELGRYEGYVVFTNKENQDEDYRLPFAVKYLKPGIESIELSRPAMSNDLEMMHFAKIPGLSARVNVSSPIDTIDVYVKDYDTKTTLGLVGKIDISYIPPGYSDNIVALDSRASYFPMDADGNIDYVRSSLRDGKYILEFVGNDAENDNQYTSSYNVLIDNEDVKINMENEPGVYEISEDMLTVEESLGQEYEAFWVDGNVSDNSIDALEEIGYDVDATSIQITGFVNGMPYFTLPVESNGDFKFGIEYSDLERGVFEFSPMPIDIATSQNLYMPPRYFFVKEGTPYHSVTLDKKEMSQGENITATIKVNNVTGSSFSTEVAYFKAFEIMDIKINKELQSILDANEYKANIKKDIRGSVSKSLDLKLDIVDKSGNPVDISGDIALIDVELKLVYESESEFYKEYIQCQGMDITDKKGEYVDISYNGTYEGVKINMQTSTLKSFQLAQGFTEILGMNSYSSEFDKYIWIEDGEGNKYDLTYDPNTQEYDAMNLPKSEEEMKLITAMPGHFRKTAKFIPSRMVDGELLGKVYYLLGSEFYRFIGAGDVNGDGVIDIHDALEVEKYYGKKVDYTKTPVDFNFDGIVDAYDMDYIVYNFGEYNEQIIDRKEPELSYNGKTLDEIINALGYNEEIRLEGMDIDKVYMDLEVGETDKITATITPDNVPGIGLEWTSDNEKVATVDSEGNVTALAPGTAGVRVKTSDNRLLLKCNVTVNINGELPEITEVVLEDKVRDVYVGDEFQLNYQIKPYDTLVSNEEYISSADSIVSVKDGKGVAHKPGKAIVTLNINEGSKLESWEINVLEREEEKIPVKSIRLNENNLKLEKGEEKQLEVTFKPEDATNKNVTWTSSDEKVATVVQGKIVAVGKGEAVITVTSEDGGYKDSCKVSVTDGNEGKQEKPEKPNKPSNPNLPQTGAMAGATMLMVAGVVAVGVGVGFRKRKRN